MDRIAQIFALTKIVDGKYPVAAFIELENTVYINPTVFRIYNSLPEDRHEAFHALINGATGTGPGGKQVIIEVDAVVTDLEEDRTYPLRKVQIFYADLSSFDKELLLAALAA